MYQNAAGKSWITLPLLCTPHVRRFLIDLKEVVYELLSLQCPEYMYTYIQGMKIE